MGRGQRIRRVVMWAAGVVLVLSVTAWVASLFRVGWRDSNLVASRTVTLSYGELRLYNIGNDHEPRGWSTRGLARPQWSLPYVRTIPDIPFGGTRWVVHLPIWMNAGCAVLVLASTLAISRADRRRMRRARCPTCHYDLTGIDGVCPECGRAHDSPPRQRRDIARARGIAPGPSPNEQTKP